MTTATAPSQSPVETESPLSVLFADLEGELATTRRMLERVPDGKDDWRPHEKSRPLGELATHIAQLPGFGILMLTRDEFDGTQGMMPQVKVTDNAGRLKMFDEVSQELRRLMEQLTWDHARSHWTLRVRDDTVLNAPRVNLLRSVVLTHSAHHRAQLGMYLRLLDLSVPWSYGPTADEGLPPA
jgi:uncharacterized damage-inducible protein DinB